MFCFYPKNVNFQTNIRKIFSTSFLKRFYSSPYSRLNNINPLLNDFDNKYDQHLIKAIKHFNTKPCSDISSLDQLAMTYAHGTTSNIEDIEIFCRMVPEYVRFGFKLYYLNYYISLSLINSQNITFPILTILSFFRYYLHFPSSPNHVYLSFIKDSCLKLFHDPISYSEHDFKYFVQLLCCLSDASSSNDEDNLTIKCQTATIEFVLNSPHLFNLHYSFMIPDIMSALSKMKFNPNSSPKVKKIVRSLFFCMQDQIKRSISLHSDLQETVKEAIGDEQKKENPVDRRWRLWKAAEVDQRNFSLFSTMQVLKAAFEMDFLNDLDNQFQLVCWKRILNDDGIYIGLSWNGVHRVITSSISSLNNDFVIEILSAMVKSSNTNINLQLHLAIICAADLLENRSRKSNEEFISILNWLIYRIDENLKKNNKSTEKKNTLKRIPLSSTFSKDVIVSLTKILSQKNQFENSELEEAAPNNLLVEHYVGPFELDIVIPPAIQLSSKI